MSSCREFLVMEKELAEKTLASYRRKDMPEFSINLELLNAVVQANEAMKCRRRGKKLK